MFIGGKYFWLSKIIKMTLRLYKIINVLILFMAAGFLQAKTPDSYTWQQIESVDFGAGANHFSIKAASEGLGGEVQLRLDAADGTVIGHAFFHHTGGSAHFIDYECDLNQMVSGTHDVYMNFLDYVDPVEDKPLNVGEFQFSMIDNSPVSDGDSLHVYNWVEDLDQSPYYEFRVQKVSDLNSGNLADATNWERPFAWFTQCVEKDTPIPYSAYYSRFIGRWSHTYCNFELDGNTPVVVKITRLNKSGAPSGPITSVVPRPARHFDKCEIIDGEVYITISNPGQLALDIDGQLDSRDAPRNVGMPKWGDVAPYANEMEGVHAVTVFANPFIDDKPDPGAANVKKVYPGDPVPEDDGSWETLFFMPGIHKMSVDANGNEREWRKSDVIDINSNRQYYIPGDAIVYGNFNSMDDWGGSIENVRLFGHGTVSGAKIPHWKDWSSALEGLDHSFLRVFEAHGAKNVIVEGITSADQAEHGIYIYGKDDGPANYLKWTKIITWRVNNDGTVLSGKSYAEDCFIRHQDDAVYVEGAGMKRCVLWTDVNGQPIRGSWISERRSGAYPGDLPTVLNYDNLDVIYARGVFHKNSVINGGSSVEDTYSDGVMNTGQHMLYSNIDVPDSNPVRVLFGITTDAEEARALKGMRFQNINYRSERAFNDGGVGSEQFHANELKGNANDDLRYFVFDNVHINGKQMDLDLMNNPEYFDAGYVSDFTFRLRDTISSNGNVLTTTVTNGVITAEETGNPGEVTLSVTTKEGYVFNGWSGDLSGSQNPVTINVDRDMAITASIDVFKYDLNVVSDNGNVTLDPAGGSYMPGTMVTLSAKGNAGYGFESWSGDLSGNENNVTIAMDSDKNVTANYKTIETFDLTIDTKYGSVVLDPPGGSYNIGTQVSLTANPDLGYIFSGWGGDLSGNQASETITMDEDKTVNTRFVFAGSGGSADIALNCGGAQYTTVNDVIFEPSSQGGSYSTDSSIEGTEDGELYQTESFGGSLSYDFELMNGPYEVKLKFAEIFHKDSGKRVFDVSIEGEVVLDNFDIVAETGSRYIALDKTFIVTIVDGVLNISMTKVVDNAKISAIQITSLPVEVEEYKLSTSATNGSITIDPEGEEGYPAGSLVSLQAVPEAGYTFIGWSGDHTGFENPADVYMEGNKNVEALFETIRNYTLTTNVTNGEISLSPDGGEYNQLEEVEISVTPNEGYKFVEWQGDLSGSDNPGTIIMNTDKAVTASIVEIPTFTLAVSGENGSVSVDPEKDNYLEGESVSLTATPNEGYRFTGWSGDLSGTENPTTIIMDTNKEVTALIEAIPAYTLTVEAVNGSVRLKPDKDEYQEGEEVTITAVADEGVRFTGWSGSLIDTLNPATLVMDGNKFITALFEKKNGIGDVLANAKRSRLLKNYPNPFYDTTTIPYHLSKTEHVRISIHNMIGQEVAVLVDGKKTGGKHKVIWNPQQNYGKSLPQGFYVCRFEAGGYVQITKLILAK